MKLAIFGATGNTGLQLVKQALERGHSVTALVRSEQALKEALSEEEFAKVTRVLGNALEKKDVGATVAGAEVVLVTLGGRKGFEDICSKAQPIIDESIKAQAQSSAASVKRQVVITSLGTGDSYKDCDWFTWTFVNTVIAKPIADKNIQESIVQRDFPAGESESPQDWVIVRPGGLGNGPLTGQYKVQERGIGGGFINRADVAAFVLDKCLEGPEYSRKAVTIVGAK